MDDVYYILTIESNIDNAYRLKKNLLDLNILEKNIIIVLGYSYTNPETYIDKYPDMKKSKIVFHNFMDFILPKMYESKKNCYYLEDHTIVFENPGKFEKKNKLVWLGFMKRLSNYIVGAHLVYLDKELIKELYENRSGYRPTYIDRFFRKIGMEKNYLYIDKSITQIVEHYSFSLNKVRKNPYNKYFYLNHN